MVELSKISSKQRDGCVLLAQAGVLLPLDFLFTGLTLEAKILDCTPPVLYREANRAHHAS
ncbi:MAG: hypothetical protein HQP61_11025 [Peptococcaceae bacterium]|nr:hypothetical protein [Candidatus Syntrophopropionicum ammoniitolerans]